MTHTIDVTADGLVIDGALVAQLERGVLTEIFGEPRIVEPGDPSADPDRQLARSWMVWDEKGVAAGLSRSGEPGDLWVRLAEDPQREGHDPRARTRIVPETVFAGTVTVSGAQPVDAVPIEKLRNAQTGVMAEAGEWEVLCYLNHTELAGVMGSALNGTVDEQGADGVADALRAIANPFRELAIGSFTPGRRRKPTTKPSGKWKQSPPTVPVVKLPTFAWRAAIIQELMYEQGVLEPRFDVDDFARDRGPHSFDPQDYMGEMIPSVRTWFRKLPVPAALAENIEHLVLDGGNDIYLQLIPQWDGEDESFDIRSLKDDDVAPFAKLRSVDDVGGFLGPRARKTLEDRGITVR
ncbi:MULTISPECIES: DUF6892 domain-containing protein [Brevibacterium]|uniref:DUF6892 domain-containing protein n=1 Tax=Brevibacterium TaxID=1696 RepID=UPI0031DF20BA